MRSINRTGASACLVGCLFLLVLAGRAAAASDCRIVNVLGSPGGYVLPGSWVDMVVTVSNRGDEDASATITCRVPNPDGSDVFFSREVAMAARTVEDVRLSLRMPPVQAQATIPRQPPPAAPADGSAPPVGEYAPPPLAETGLSFTLSVNGTMVSKHPYQVMTLTDRLVPVVVIAGPGGEVHDVDYLDKLPDRQMGEVRIVSAFSGERIPDRWWGLEMVDAAFLKPSGERTLRASQVQAILDWVRRGGVLVVTGGEGVEDILAGPIGQAAGVAAAGIHRVSTLAVTELGDKGEVALAPVHLDWPLPMVTLCVEGAAVRYTGNGLPLLVERGYGQGRIVTLAVPVGALADASLHTLLEWASMPRTGPGVPAISAGGFLTERPGGAASAAREAIQSTAGRRGPSPATPFAVIAAMLVLIVAAAVVFARKRRGELVWAGLIPVAVIAGVAIYVVGRTQVSPEQLSRVGLIAPVTDDEAWYREACAYYGGADSRELTFSAGNPRGTIGPINLGETATGRDEVRMGPVMTIPGREVPTGSTFGFALDGMQRLRVITGQVGFDESGLAMTVTNHLPEDITNAVIYARNRTYRAESAAPGDEPGRLKAGAETRLVIDNRQLLKPVVFRPLDPDAKVATMESYRGETVAVGEFTGSQVLTDIDDVRNRLVGRLVQRARVDSRVSKTPVLIGYTAFSPADPLKGRDLVRQGWSVVLWPLRFSPPPAPREALIPAGFVDLDYVSRGGQVWNPMNETFVATRMPGELVVIASPPPGAGELTGAEAIITVSIHASGYRMTVSGVKNARFEMGRMTGGESVEIESFDNARLIDRVIAVPNADDYRLPSGAYVLSLKVQRQGQDAGPVDLTGVSEWSFDSVNVALKGTLK